jgi:glycerol uptake facilitator-like aquaporin|tara:strand:- start:574 stop:1221 length:648 start_codon:yes stop_codon:yes gene_type:complete
LIEMKSKYFSEFLGTAFLFCTVVGSGIMGQNLSSNESLTLLANTLATVFALYFLITIFGDHSSHFNPVVSMVMLVRKEISTQVCTIFIILQISGAILGVMLANYIFELDPVLFSEKPRSGTHLFVSEILATFGLLMVILLSAKEKVAVTVAAYIGAAYWFTSSTSFANPAGTIGRSFSNTFAGISAHDILHFCVAQIIGAFLALIVYRTFFESQK